MYFIGEYGQTDGGHHKTWFLDQVARVLNGTPVIIKITKWTSGLEEYRIDTTDTPSRKYKEWREWMKGDIDSDGEPTYGYDEGCPP